MGADHGEREEYVTDVAYLRNFVEDLAPARLRLATALNGFAPPPAHGFGYCELGCGNGDTLATLAAAHPDARFVGVDINADHIAVAQGLAESGGLDNARFLVRDFEAMADDDLGPLHYVGAHGVLSWVSPEKRRALIAFAAARLEPGGVLTVSYNALPGWAAIEPLRRLLLDASSGVRGSSVDRARHALAAAKLLRDAGADYFVHNPTARSMLDTMEKGGLAYVAHEYFHTHWNPMYFADVAGEMAAAGLHFAGGLPLYANYKDLTIPPSLGELFKGIADRIVLERMKDFAVNEFFRRDVYVKGRAACSPANTQAYLDVTPFGAPAGRVHREVKLPHYTLRYAGDLFDAIVPALSGASATASELARRPELAAYGVARVRDALLRLALGDQVTPMAESAEAPVVTGAGERRFTVPSPYNRMILAQRLSRTTPVVLASRRASTGLTLSTLHAACLHLVTEVDLADRPSWIRRFVAERAPKLFDGDRLVTDPEEQARVIEAQLDEFCARRVPELFALGILAD